MTDSHDPPGGNTQKRDQIIGISCLIGFLFLLCALFPDLITSKLQAAGRLFEAFGVLGIKFGISLAIWIGVLIVMAIALVALWFVGKYALKKMFGGGSGGGGSHGPSQGHH